MHWTRLKQMKLDLYLASVFVYKARMFWGGGELWEGGDLERLSLVDDEEPNPMSVLYTRVRLLLLKVRVVFLQAEIFNFNHMFQKIYQ